MARSDRPNPDNSRKWSKKDAYKDRGVTERPMSKHHWDRQETTYDAVPELHYRPGRHN